MSKVKRYLGTYRVISPVIIERDISNPEFKPLYRYKLLNILNNDLYFPVNCKHKLKPDHIYYGEIREYGMVWRFAKKIIIENND